MFAAGVCLSSICFIIGSVFAIRAVDEAPVMVCEVDEVMAWREYPDKAVCLPNLYYDVSV